MKLIVGENKPNSLMVLHMCKDMKDDNGKQICLKI